MNIQRWIARREADWRRLEELLERAETKGLRTLRAGEIRELAGLYRSVAADLARARSDRVGEFIYRDLQQLTARGYNQIYQGSRRQEWLAVVHFYRQGFPALVRQTIGYTALAMTIFLVFYLIGWWFVWQDPGFIEYLAPESLIARVRDEGELWMGSIVGVEPLASSNIMLNNISVSFGAVGGGITAGIYTSYIMIINGLHIGAIAAFVTRHNLAYPFWAFVFPHGALELPAIFLAGGAGLLVGGALVFPGEYRRLEALKYQGVRAAQLLFGIVPMLFIAGLIEGFFSPSPMIPEPLKYLVGVGLLGLLIVYFETLEHK